LPAANVDGASRATSRGACWSAPRTLPDVESRDRRLACRSTSTAADAVVLAGRPLRSSAAPETALTNTVDAGLLRHDGVSISHRTRLSADLATSARRAGDRQPGIRGAGFLDGGEPIGRRLDSRGTTYVIARVVRNSLSDSLQRGAAPVIYLSYTAIGRFARRNPPPHACGVRDAAGAAARTHRARRSIPSCRCTTSDPDGARREEPVSCARAGAHVRRARPLLLLLARSGATRSSPTPCRSAQEIGSALRWGHAQRPGPAHSWERRCAWSARGERRLMIVIFLNPASRAGSVVSVRVVRRAGTRMMLVAAWRAGYPQRAATVDPMVALRQE
jgi:hypothetical protein